MHARRDVRCDDGDLGSPEPWGPAARVGPSASHRAARDIHADRMGAFGGLGGVAHRSCHARYDLPKVVLPLSILLRAAALGGLQSLGGRLCRGIT